MSRGSSGSKRWVPWRRPPATNAQPSTSTALAEDRADQGGLHHGGQAVAQGEQPDEQLGQVAERRLQQSRRARTEPFAHLLDGLPDQTAARAARARPASTNRSDRRRRRCAVATPATTVSATAAPSVTRWSVFEMAQVGSERHGRPPTVAAQGGRGADDG